MIRSILLAVITLLYSQACLAANDPQRVETDWRHELSVFRVGVAKPALSGKSEKSLRPFSQALQEALGMPVQIIFANDQKNLLQKFLSGEIDYAVFSATAFSSAWANCKCVEPLAVPKTIDGSRGFHSVLVSRDGAIKSLKDLQGKTTVIPGRHSFSGYIHPRSAFAQQDIELGSKDWPILDQQDMETAMDAFEKGKGAALTGWMPMNENSPRGTLYRLKQEGGDDYHTVWKSELLPHGPHTVRKRLNGEAKVLLATFLMQMHSQNPKAYDVIEPIFGGGFVQSAIEDYEIIIRFLTARPNQKNDDVTGTIPKH